MSANWNTIQGDLDKLIADDSYDDFVILERSEASLEQLKKSENDSPKVMQIVIGRSEKSPISISLYLGTGIRRTEKTLIHFTQNFSYFDDENLEYDIARDIKGRFFDSSFLYSNDLQKRQKASALQDSLVDNGRLVTKNHGSFATGIMRPYLGEMLFESLQKMKLLEQADVEFFKSISIYRKSSIGESNLNEKLEKAFNEGDYKEALKIANALHAMSRKEAFDKKSLESDPSSASKKDKKLTVYDDCEAAFKLGEALEPISPADAIAAFEIITAYEMQENSFDAIYKSPLISKAQTKLCDIKISLLGSTSNKEIARKTTKEALLSAFLARIEDMSETDTLKLSMKLIETQAGFNNMGFEDRLFDRIDTRIDESNTFIGILLDMMLTMADKLSELKKPTRSLDEDDSVVYEIDLESPVRP